MFRPDYQRIESDRYLIENQGVDSAIIALALGLTVPQVQAYQRKLGLRKITGYVRKAER